MLTFRHFINGDCVEGGSTGRFALVSPVTGEAYASSPNADDAEVDAACAAAPAAFKVWADSPPSACQKALLAFAPAGLCQCG